MIFTSEFDMIAETKCYVYMGKFHNDNQKKNGKNNVLQFKIKFTILLMKQSIKRYLFAKYLHEHFK